MSTHGLPPFDPRWAWFLDIDGTLLDIAAMPAAVHPAPADNRLVTALFAATQGALALISGRSLGDIDKMFAPLHLPAAGPHGIERRFAGRTPVFIGDDLTDEYGFAVVNRLGGHTIKVGRGETTARWRISNAAAVRRWLSEGLAVSGADPLRAA